MMVTTKGGHYRGGIGRRNPLRGEKRKIVVLGMGKKRKTIIERKTRLKEMKEEEEYVVREHLVIVHDQLPDNKHKEIDLRNRKILPLQDVNMWFEIASKYFRKMS